MKDADAYLNFVRALVVESPFVTHWDILREETQGDLGLYRFRLTLTDGSIIEMFERYQIVKEEVSVTKYSFHWQDSSGCLRKRWDNAPHHPEVSTHPHHLHDGAEDHVVPHDSMTCEKLILVLATEFGRKGNTSDL